MNEKNLCSKCALGEIGKGFDARRYFPKDGIIPRRRRRIAGLEEGWLVASSDLEARLLIWAETLLRTRFVPLVPVLL